MNHQPPHASHAPHTCLIGIFGGSFNPIHVGHIALGRAILAQGEIDELWFMVSPQNPLKPQSGLIDETVRLQLARKAIAGEAQMKASDFEFSLPRPSYTWHTLEALQEAYPECEFKLIIGGDNWANFSKWYRHDDILQSYRLLVYPREGEKLEVHDGVTIIHAPLLPVSSTMIRRRIADGLTISGLVPETIRREVETIYKRENINSNFGI